MSELRKFYLLKVFAFVFLSFFLGFLLFAQSAPDSAFAQGAPDRQAYLETPEPEQPVIEGGFDYGVFTDLAQTTAENGSVRLIVQLDTNFQPEGHLSGTQAVINQRQAIQSTQNRLINSISSSTTNVHRQYKTIPFIAVETDLEGLKKLIQSDYVIGIEEDQPVPMNLDMSVPLIGGDAARIAGFDGEGWAVAILDTGVDKTHPFLSGKVVSEACFSSNAEATYWNSPSTSFCPGGVETSIAINSGIPCPANVDGCDHGTHVAGIAAGNNSNPNVNEPEYGVAPGADVIAIQVFSRFDDEDVCGGSYYTPCAMAWNSDYTAALDYVLWLKNNTSINIASVNMSLGSNTTYNSPCDSISYSLTLVINNLKSVGIATIISSGNGGVINGISSPACISSAISVGATTDSDNIASYSNSASILDLLAPGSSINSSVPGTGYQSWNGTSMAAPHVTGAWAVMRQRYPTASVDEILGYFNDTGVMITDLRNGITKPRIQLDEALNLSAVTLSAGTYDDADDAIFYSGVWSQVDIAGSTEGHHHASHAIGNSTKIVFNGRQVGVIYFAFAETGNISVYIDDVLVDTIDSFSEIVQYQNIWSSDELSTGQHSLRLVHSSGTHIVIDGLIIRELALDPPSLVSPSSNAVLYECQPEFSWSSVADASHYELNILPYGFNGTNINSTPSAASFTPSAVLRPDTYFWRVRTWDSSLSSDWSTGNWFTINIGAPNNVSPVTNDGTYSLTPTFDWSDICGADGYDLFAVRYDETGTPQTAIYTGTTASEYKPPSDLTPGIYAWYVRAKSGTSYGPWNTFYWLTLFIGAPNLQTPVTNDLVTPYPQFSWTDVAGATGYDLFVVKIAGEGNTTAIYEEYIPTTSYTDSDPLASGIYAWYVRARAGHWVGPWTNFYWFVVP